MNIRPEMNYGSIIFDAPDGKTINGIPAGLLSRRIVGPDQKPPPIDVNRIIDAFHLTKEGDSQSCVYSGLVADGINCVDGNPNNFLITNLEPINKSFLFRLPPLPKVIITKLYPKCGKQRIPYFDLELEVSGLVTFVDQRLGNLTIPEIPEQLGLEYTEAELMWIWNELTKKSLLKGLVQLTMHNKLTNTSISLSNRAVMEFLMLVLQQDLTKKEQENE